jgi:S1-C subfamily serine protease
MCRKLVGLLVGLSLVLLSNISEGRSLKDVFERVNPSVVMILTTERSYSRVEPGEQVTSKGLGSGVVISKDGLVMTAAHVVQVADEVVVEFLGGYRIGAKVIGSAARADVALLQLDDVPQNVVPVGLGDADKVSVGEEVFVVGAPYGVSHTLTVGHISGRRKPQTFCDQMVAVEFLQTDAAINKGNSGGPMFSMDGEVIGIVSRFLSQSGGFEGLGFAISINTARALLLEQRSFWTGLEVYVVSGVLAKALNVPQEAGLLVQRVADDSPGYHLGLRAGDIPVRIGREELLIGGDILLEVQGIPISTDPAKMCQIRDTMTGLIPGDRIDVKVLREGHILNLFAPE